jgi:hypothetical protein
MFGRSSNLSRWIKEWPFFAAVAVLLILGTWWSRPRGSIPADEVREIVGERLAEELRLESIDLTLFGTRARTDGSQIASVRLQDELLDLRFEGLKGEWSWQGVVRSQGIESSVEDYAGRLRDGNELGAIDVIRLVQTAQVAARVRTGSFLPIARLEQDGYLPTDLGLEGPAGYRLDTDISEVGYRIFLLPMEYPWTGVRSFYGDDTLEVRGSDRGGDRAGPEDPLVIENWRLKN